MSRIGINLAMAEEIRRPSSAIQVSRRGASRLPNPQEARSLALGALWTLDRTSGGIRVTTARDADGKPVAVVLIENAEFRKNDQGFSTLIQE
jgi:hypothetical protein